MKSRSNKMIDRNSQSELKLDFESAMNFADLAWKAAVNGSDQYNVCEGEDYTNSVYIGRIILIADVIIETIDECFVDEVQQVVITTNHTEDVYSFHQGEYGKSHREF